MAEIEIETTCERAYRVTVLEGGSASTHDVTIPAGYAEGLGLEAGEALVRASFEFLLEREPKESILSRFDLPAIARYFPEYPGEIGRRMNG